MNENNKPYRSRRMWSIDPTERIIDDKKKYKRNKRVIIGDDDHAQWKRQQKKTSIRE
jgi:hypothetical protein